MIFVHYGYSILIFTISKVYSGVCRHVCPANRVQCGVQPSDVMTLSTTTASLYCAAPLTVSLVKLHWRHWNSCWLLTCCVCSGPVEEHVTVCWWCDGCWWSHVWTVEQWGPGCVCAGGCQPSGVSGVGGVGGVSGVGGVGLLVACSYIYVISAKLYCISG